MNSNLIEQFSNIAKEQVPAGLPVDEWIRVYNEKLAELIVRECMSLVSEPGPDMNDTERGILAQIKQHFGIENERTD